MYSIPFYLVSAFNNGFLSSVDIANDKIIAKPLSKEKERDFEHNYKLLPIYLT